MKELHCFTKEQQVKEQGSDTANKGFVEVEEEKKVWTQMDG